jgi:hypothetical protein
MEMIMAFRTFALAGAAGYLLYKYLAPKSQPTTPVAFASGESRGNGFVPVRNAGPDAMRSNPPRWDSVDQASDESFPASDPPSTY